jgi:hypothetical protein
VVTLPVNTRKRDVVGVLTGSLVAALAVCAGCSSQVPSAAGEKVLAAESAGPWKYSVEILVSDQYQVGLPQEFDALYRDQNDHLWVRAYLHWTDEKYQGSDYYRPRSAQYTLISEDKGRTWERTDAPFPFSCKRSVLSDGTIVEVASNWWERHPIERKEELEKKGYHVRLDPRNEEFCSIIYDTWVRRSTDSGKTWEVQALHKKLPFFSYFVARHYQATLKDDVIVSFHYGMPKADDCRNSYVLRSEDKGVTWQLIMIADGTLSPAQHSGVKVPGKGNLYCPGFGETFPVVYPDGRILAMVRTQLSGDAFVVRSMDGGKTWSAPEKSPIKEKHPTLTLLSDGVVVCTYPRRSEKPYGIGARFTSDMGKTWSGEVILRDEFEIEDGLAFPLTVEFSDGTLFTAVSGKKYVDTEIEIANGRKSKVRQFLSGTRWTRDYRHTPTLDPPRPPREPVDNWKYADRSPWENNWSR